MIATASSTWVADAVPLNIQFADDRAARAVALLVVAGEHVVHTKVLRSLRGDAADVAAALEGAVVAAASDAGVFPERVLVRHDDVAAALAPMLASRRVAVAVGESADLVEAARELRNAMQVSANWPPLCRSLTWLGWELPPALVTEVFHAAATFYERAPWRDIANLQAPRAVLPSGREWTCCVLGNGGEEYGLALYSEPGDLTGEPTADDPADAVAGVRGRIVTLTYDRISDTEPEAVAELRRNRWQIAGPAAYPSLITVNTPGGGVTRADMTDMIALLRSLPDFVATHARLLRREANTDVPLDPVAWTDPASGIVFRYAGSAFRVDDDDEMEPLDPLRAELRAALLSAVEELGEDADRDALLAHANRSLAHAMERLNDAPQPEFGGLSPNQVRALMEGDWLDPGGGIELRGDLTLRDVAHTEILANARTLLELVRERGGLGATQAGNLKLDAVAELLGTLRFDDGYVELIQRHNKRITEADVLPLHRLRIVCGLAGLLRRRSQRFELTAAGKRLLDDARAGELYRLLFHTWFRKFNLAYGTRVHWPELQAQVGYTLYSLLSVATDWRAPDELSEHVVLPYALQHAPASAFPDINLAAIDLGVGVLDPLVGFGVLERRPERTIAMGRSTDEYRTTPLAHAFIQFHL